MRLSESIIILFILNGFGILFSFVYQPQTSLVRFAGYVPWLFWLGYSFGKKYEN